MDEPETDILSILVPGLFSTIAKFLDDEQMHALKQQSQAFRTFINQEQEANSYWLARLEKKLGIELWGFVLDWKSTYKLALTRGKQFTIVSILPKEQLLGWLSEELKNADTNKVCYSRLHRS